MQGRDVLKCLKIVYLSKIIDKWKSTAVLEEMSKRIVQ